MEEEPVDHGSKKVYWKFYLTAVRRKKGMIQQVREVGVVCGKIFE